jgi:hypothetical protein
MKQEKLKERIEQNKRMIRENKRMIRENNVFLAIVIPLLFLQFLCLVMACISK